MKDKKARFFNLNILIAIIIVSIVVIGGYLILFYAKKPIKEGPLVGERPVAPVSGEEVPEEKPKDLDPGSCELSREERCCMWFIDGNKTRIEEECRDQRIFLIYAQLENKPELCLKWDPLKKGNTNKISQEESKLINWMLKNIDFTCNIFSKAYSDSNSIEGLNSEFISRCSEESGYGQCNSIDLQKNAWFIDSMAVKDNNISKCGSPNLDEYQKYQCKAFVSRNYSLCAPCLHGISNK